jgi:hypothetical protein
MVRAMPLCRSRIPARQKDMSNSAAAPSLVTRCVPASRPGYVRYEMRDASGLVGEFELREDRAHEHFECYVRAFLDRYPPRRVGPALRLLP